MKIAYISQKLPNVTETFVYREIFALREQGVTVIPLSIHTPFSEKLAEEVKALAEETTFVFPLDKRRFLTAHAYFLLTRPHRYLHTLWFVLTRSAETAHIRQRTLYHFAEAVYLARHAQREGVEHIHAHFSVNAASVALVMSRLLGIRFSFTVHNNIFTDRLLLREKLEETKFVAVISAFSRDFLLNRFPDLPKLADKFQIIHCGVSLTQFKPLAKQVGRKPMIFSLAQLAERKGMPVLIEAARLLRDQGYEFECIIAGDGAQRAQLTRLIADYQLEDWVFLVGVVYQEALADYFARTDIFALACITAQNGDMDGVPVVLMEAMAMEIPVVSTTVSGIPELVTQEKNGLLVPEKDAPALATALARLLDAPELRAKFGRAGRQKVQAEFNIDHTSTQIGTLFARHLRVTAPRQP